MSDDVFMENLIGLIKNKLVKHNSLEEECSDLWSEIVDFRYEWQSSRNEAVWLQNVRKQQVLEAYDRWLFPICDEGKERECRCFTVSVERVDGDKDSETQGDAVDERVKQFHDDLGNENWGKIVYNSS